ncbi:glutamate-rich protein 2 isoform X3 [Leucoraja erinacea]|uniref:glutamate-rich protein 2 isoform X3 n=1 Tax=Leucoraja erinaceus TaxID=7782 RepID=UPI0024584618|nr:glutamate-rich protein 2 isoform X3 [Leucoraja erinacea]
MKKLKGSKRFSRKEQKKDVKKQPAKSMMNDIKMSTTSSDTKEANALDISANPVEPTTSNANRTLEHSKGADNLTDTENDDDDDDIDGKSNSREEKTAPIELMGEFLKAVMERDYKLSSKLCQMILLYEPENPEAKQFKELLEIKIKLDEAASTHQDDGEESNESDNSNEDDSEDSNDESERSDEESIASTESENT